MVRDLIINLLSLDRDEDCFHSIVARINLLPGAGGLSHPG